MRTALAFLAGLVLGAAALFVWQKRQAIKTVYDNREAIGNAVQFAEAGVTLWDSVKGKF